MKRQTYMVHTLGDPALAGLTATEVIRYAKSRNTDDLPEIKEQPITFTYRRLTRDVIFDFVETGGNDKRRDYRAFTASVIRIEGGDFGEAWVPEGVGQKGYVSMSEDEVESLIENGIALADITDVGQVAYIRSILNPKAVPSFPLQPSSLAAWDALVRPSAEPTLGEQPPSSEERNAA